MFTFASSVSTRKNIWVWFCSNIHDFVEFLWIFLEISVFLFFFYSNDNGVNIHTVVHDIFLTIKVSKGSKFKLGDKIKHNSTGKIYDANIVDIT